MEAVKSHGERGRLGPLEAIADLFDLSIISEEVHEGELSKARQRATRALVLQHVDDTAKVVGGVTTRAAGRGGDHHVYSDRRLAEVNRGIGV